MLRRMSLFFSTTTRTCHEFGPRKKVRIIRNRRHVTFLGMHHCQYWIVSARINMARELILTGGGGGNNKGNVRGRLTKLYTRHAKIRKLFTAGGSHNGWPVPCLAIVERQISEIFYTTFRNNPSFSFANPRYGYSPVLQNHLSIEGHPPFQAQIWNGSIEIKVTLFKIGKIS